jgi:hypothetical protein
MSEHADQFDDREDDELEPLEQARQGEGSGEDEGEREAWQEKGD